MLPSPPVISFISPPPSSFFYFSNLFYAAVRLIDPFPKPIANAETGRELNTLNTLHPGEEKN